MSVAILTTTVPIKRARMAIKMCIEVVGAVVDDAVVGTREAPSGTKMDGVPRALMTTHLLMLAPLKLVSSNAITKWTHEAISRTGSGCVRISKILTSLIPVLLAV